MRRIACILFLGAVSVLSIGARPQGGLDPSWAFQLTEADRPASPEETGPLRTPGSTRTYTREEIGDLSNPPDWFPDEDAPKPDVVLRGHDAVFACGSCHLMSGLGHPESADLAGLSSEYIVRQLEDFKSGVRQDFSRMNTISEAMSDEEMRQSADWFASLTPMPWNRVVETDTVPSTYVGEGRMRFAHPDGTTEPIGNRIITLPEEPGRARNRDPKSGFIAYVPSGSLARGEDLVRNGGGGRTIACTICHGEDLRGLATVPRLAGLHSIYLARQLYLFQNGQRDGIDAALMDRSVAQLNDEDIVAISAYLGSLAP